MALSYTLYDELENRNIDFIDGFGTILFNYNNYSKNIYGYGSITNWNKIKIKKIKKNNKYYKLCDIENDYYIGDFADGMFTNMMVEIYKLSIPIGLYNKKKYILMILDNPNYNEYSNETISKGKYKILFFDIIKYNKYIIKLKFNNILTSNI
jgi:hypothetical protein